MLRRAVCLGMVRRAQAPLRDDKLSKETMSSLRGVPMNNLKRKVQIFNYFPASTQNEMHSVESDMWVLKFAEQPRWSHNLMGWTSTRDPNHGLKMKFPSKEAAIKFAEEQGEFFYIFCVF